MAGRGVIATRSVHLRQGLTTGEAALTVVLLAAAGLLIRTLIHLKTMPPGFTPGYFHTLEVQSWPVASLWIQMARTSNSL